MAHRIPNARPLPQVLWSYLEHAPVRWSARSAPINCAWALAQVGHPFAGMPELPPISSAEETNVILGDFLEKNNNLLEVGALQLILKHKLGATASKETTHTILSAEAWRNQAGFIKVLWHRSQGIKLWNRLLRGTPPSHLEGTPFEPLAIHPKTYSGEDKNGGARLLNIAEEWGRRGAHRIQLAQLRNAAMILLLTNGEYSATLCHQIADCATAVRTQSLSSAVARETARVGYQGP